MDASAYWDADREALQGAVRPILCIAATAGARLERAAAYEAGAVARRGGDPYL